MAIGWRRSGLNREREDGGRVDIMNSRLLYFLWIPGLILKEDGREVNLIMREDGGEVRDEEEVVRGLGSEHVVVVEASTSTHEWHAACDKQTHHPHPMTHPPSQQRVR